MKTIKYLAVSICFLSAFASFGNQHFYGAPYPSGSQLTGSLRALEQDFFNCLRFMNPSPLKRALRQKYFRQKTRYQNARLNPNIPAYQIQATFHKVARNAVDRCQSLSSWRAPVRPSLPVAPTTPYPTRVKPAYSPLPAYISPEHLTDLKNAYIACLRSGFRSARLNDLISDVNYAKRTYMNKRRSRNLALRDATKHEYARALQKAARHCRTARF